MPRRAPAVALLTAMALAGCGTNARDAVKAKVEQYAKATRQHDYKTICTQVLAPTLVQRLNAFGVGCEQAMAIAYSSVRDATLGVGKITVSGKSASVIVLSLAANQPSSLRTIRLLDTSQGWRISSVGGAS